VLRTVVLEPMYKSLFYISMLNHKIGPLSGHSGAMIKALGCLVQVHCDVGQQEFEKKSWKRG
jgi:hypothetical protein